MNISNELGLIGEKAVKDWLRKRHYPFRDAGEVAFALGFDPFDVSTGIKPVRLWHEDQLGGVSWEIAPQSVRLNGFLTTEERKRLKALLNSFSKVRLRRGKHRAGHGYHHSNVLPDFIVKMPELAFLEVKVNNSRVEPNQRSFLRMAKTHGIEARVAHVSIRVANTVRVAEYR